MAIVASLALALTAACTAPSESAADEEDPPLPATVVEAADRDIKGRIADAVDLDGVDLWVGSPAAEAGDATSAILAALTIRSLEEAGATVRDRSDFGNGLLVRDALVSGEIDLYWEGTGQVWTAILRQPAEGLSGEDIRDQLARRDLDENGIAWLPAAPFEDGARFAVAKRTARNADLTTMSDMRDRLERDDDALTCVTKAFNTYPNDGRVDVEAALGMTFDDDRLREYQPEPIYPDTKEGQCLFGLVDATSGRIPEYDLAVLEDDLGAFLPNAPAPAVREDVLVAHPEIATVLTALADRLTAEDIRSMNRQIVREERDVQTVTDDWLRNKGLIE
jgi:osmoprotectant transport system substrate-binding protein